MSQPQAGQKCSGRTDFGKPCPRAATHYIKRHDWRSKLLGSAAYNNLCREHFYRG